MEDFLFKQSQKKKSKAAVNEFCENFSDDEEGD
jgi:hypothetical protein